MKNIKHAIIIALSALTFTAAGAASAGGYMQTQQQGVKIIAASTQSIKSNAHQNVSRQHAPAQRYDRNYFNQHRVIYRVRPGDTLSKIAIRSGVSMNKLARLNKLYGNKKNRLLVGQILKLR